MCFYLLPEFLCVGVPKSGTTTLHEILYHHPDVYLPPNKEIGFFSNNELFKKGLKYYSAFYPNSSKNKLRGEICPNYSTSSNSAERIFKSLGGNIKLIFLLRSPVERAYSEYLHKVRRYEIKGDFEFYIRKYFQNKFPINDYGIISNSLYVSQIEKFFKFFDPQNIFYIVLEEDFKPDNIKKTFTELSKFLGIYDYPLDMGIKSNKGYTPKLEIIQKIIHKENLFRRFMKYSIPSKRLRYNIRSFLFKVNSKNKLDNYPGLSDTVKVRLLNDIFLNEKPKLEKIIDRDLSFWYEV